MDLVGDKLREVFNIPDLAISWHDEKANLLHHLYDYEHGKRLKLPPHPPVSGGMFETMTKTRQPIIFNSVADYEKMNAIALPGTDQGKSYVAVPIISSDRVLGIVGIENYERENAFGESEIRLLTTIAASLGTALENARLFDEVQKKNAEITESLERETASANILQVIAESPTNIQPVLDVIARNAATLSGSEDAIIAIEEAGILRVSAHYGDIPMIPVGEGIRFNRDSVAGRAMIERIPLQGIHNQRGVKSEYPEGDKVAKKYGYRMSCSVPLMREGKAVGVITIRRIKPELLTDKQIALVQSFANQAAIAVENVRLFEAEQQRVAELQIVNSVQLGLASKLDMQAIFELVGEKIRTIFDAQSTIIATYEYEKEQALYRYVAEKGERFDGLTMPFNGFHRKIIQERKTILYNENLVEQVRALGYEDSFTDNELPKSALNVPLLVGNQVLGHVALENLDREHAFSESDVRLLETLANSMSVALENARLFDETQRLLKETEQRAAELETVNTISRALSGELDLAALIELIGEQIRRVFRADIAYVALLDESAQTIRFPYTYGEALTPMAYGQGLTSKIIETGEPLLINRDLGKRRAELRATQVGVEARSYLGVPIFVGGKSVGAVSVQSTQAENAFDENHQRLLATIASNVGVALQNARLFEEIQTRNREVTESLEQQTATSEILRVIAQSPTDIQPVLNVIVENARRLCNANMSAVYRTDGAMVYEVASSDVSGDVLETAREVSSQAYPAPLRWDSTLSSRAILSREIVHIPDMEHAPDLPEITRRYVQAKILNSVLQVPMIREGEAIGAIGVGKRDPAPFTEKQVALMQTFASQAVIAIENVRLFNELQTRNREITEALELQTATSKILQVIASSPTNIQPVMQVIAEHAVRLCDGLYCGVYQTDGVTIDQVAEANFTPEALTESRRAYPRPLTRDASLSSQTILDKAVINIPDILEDATLPEVTHRYARALGMNSILFVPLLRDQEAIGSIGVGRSEKGLFPEKNIALLQTFASQAVIAIENVRLFNELQQSNAEITESLEYQTAISEILRVIASSPTDIQPVLDAISESALKLCGANFSAVYNYDGKMLDMTALKNFTPQATEEIQREYPRPLTRDGGYSARSILEKKVIHVTDALNDPDIPEATRPLVASLGFRSGLWVPMLREGNAIGAFCVARPEAGAFDEKKIQLLQTFADQATIAIENVRLFTETQRLLKETEQRAAELQIINSVQDGLASKLEVQAIYDLVGDKIRDIFHAQGTAIFLFDHDAGLSHTPYCFLGQRYPIDSAPFTSIDKLIMDSSEPIKFGTNEEYVALGGSKFLEGGKHHESGMYVPLVIGKTVKGMVGVSNLEKKYAYNESDLRLLQTLANSMSVALENARLFDETQRLLQETEQRAAELQIINSVQEGLASKLDVQAIYDLVGDKIRDIFHAQGTAIYLFKREAGIQQTP
ncbi:MAG: GAF domain-containing protein, partial [Chloroflexota bacterium]